MALVANFLVPKIAAKVELTDRGLSSLTPGIHWDALGPTGSGCRVSAGGRITWFLAGRYSGVPTYKKLGTYPGMSLKEYREKAREWRAALLRGEDPSIKNPLPQAKAAELTLRDVYTDYEKRVILRVGKPGGPQRQHVATIGIFEHRIMTVLGSQLPGNTRKSDVLALIDGIRGHAMKHRVYGCLRSLMNFAVERGHIEVSPCVGLRPSSDALIGPRNEGERALDDSEIRAFWKACETNSFGHIYRLLLLTGLRRNEVAGAKWGEFDFAEQLWTVPGERMKLLKDRKLRPHCVPLTEPMLRILSSLPRYANGDYLFSANFGISEVRDWAKKKRQLDAAMRKILGTLKPWDIRDLRRTTRTHLEAFPGVAHIVSERILAHQQRGMDRVYNRYEYLPEKRQALELWAAELAKIVDKSTT